MQHTDPFKKVIDDFVKEKDKLHKSIREFNQLQQEIDDLKKRASKDIQAQKKLQRVQKIMDSDFQQQRQCLIEKVSALQSNMENLRQMMQEETGIKKITLPTKNTNVAVAKKNMTRAFV